ncbi:MAG TPA: pyridoxal phosphate-dependent aminotransferase [Polyangiaceae bacterium]|nr:pyridoxal phosphate-dependent aminotransferase [Polyangiaceae bacterium]
MFSRRSASEHQENALYAALGAMREAGTPYLDLTVSNPTVVGLRGPSASLAQILANVDCSKYEPAPLGMPSAREAAAQHFRQLGVALPSEQVLLTASTSESYSFLFNLLCDAGDEVLIPAPSYPLFEYLARFANVTATPYRLAYDGAWHIDFDSLTSAVTPRTRAVVLVNPNNPTGSYVSKQEWLRLAQFGLPLISDEVFARYPLIDDAQRPLSALCVLQGAEVPLFVLDGLSKYAGLPQLKLGMMAYACPSALGDELHHRLEMIADTFLSVSTPVQAALPQLLRHGKTTHDHIQERISTNYGTLRTLVRDSAATLLRAEGGWSAVLQLPQTLSEQAWVLRLLQERRVLVQPGWFFDFATEPFVVVSLLTPPDDFARGVQAILGAVG